MDCAAMHAAVTEARPRVGPHVRRTPLELSPGLSIESGGGAQVYLKMENDQVTGSFKVRGAINKLGKLQEGGGLHGNSVPVTASTGNHALACTYAKQRLGVDCSVFVPKTISPAKESALKMAGCQPNYHGTDCVEAEVKARQVAKERGVPFISPYNDYDVIAGQGTIGAEILEDLQDVDAVFVSVGGGGLIGGIAAFIKAVRPDVKVIGCQPERSKVMYESVKAGRIVTLESGDTLSDGTAGGIEENSVTLGLCQQYVDRWVIVGEQAIGQGIYLMLKFHHKVVEGAAGLVVAAFLQVACEYSGKKVALVSCGANIGVDKLKTVINSYG